MKLSLRSLFLTLVAMTLMSVTAFSQTATIATDQADYAPGSTVIITGSGFLAGETVTLRVVHQDPTFDNSEPTHQPWTVIADGSGNVSATWLVNEDLDQIGATLVLTADGQTSGFHAETTFTDSPLFSTLSVGAQSPASVGPGGTATFIVTVTKGTGSGTGNLTVTGLPAGASGSFSPSSLSFAGGDPNNTATKTSTLTITTNCTTTPPNAITTFTATITKTTGGGGDNASGTHTLTVGAKLVATAVITQALCHGDPASVVVTATGGTGPYTGTGTFPLADGASSTYTVQDSKTCSATSNSVTATSPTQLVATAVITQALCHGGLASVTITATGGTGPYIGTGTHPQNDGITANYTVIDANGCSAISNSVTATSPPQVVVTAVITQALCHGDPASVLVTATGGTGSYTGTGTFPLADGASSTYTVHDANNCSATSNSVTATSPSQVVATAVITQALCHGGAASVLVTATGGTGAYTGTGTFSLADGASAIYTVKDANNCSAESNEVTATSPSQIIVTATITQALCHGDPASVLVTATGGTGSYTGTGTFSLADGASSTYTVQDANNCSATSNSVTATSPSQVVATAVITQALCNGGPASVLVTATGGTGAYTGTGTFPLADGASSTYTVSDANGCSAISNSVTATSPSVVTGTCSNNNPALYFGYAGDQTSTITGKATGGGTGPYKIEIKMSRPLMCDVVNSAGDEVWNPSGGSVITSGNACGSTPVSTLSGVSLNGTYSVNVTLLDDADFYITIIDANGCRSETCTTHVHGEDVRCFAGNSGVAKVKLCHKTGSTKTPCVTICVDADAVQDHLAHGDFYGQCTNDCKPPVGQTGGQGGLSTMEATAEIAPAAEATFGAKVYPNPSSNYFNLKLSSASNESFKITVADFTGRVIEQRNNIAANTTIQLGGGYQSGTYFVEVIQGNNRVVVKMVKAY